MSDKTNEQYDEFDIAIFEDAWTFLCADDLSFALKVEKAVNRGSTPEELKRRFLARAGEHRSPKAIRIENAARFLEWQKQRA